MGEPSELDRLVSERNVEQALMRMGVGFVDCAGLVVFDPDEATASWRYDKNTGEESIHIGPLISSLDVNGIEMVLRHEVLHRSMYHGFGEQYAHPELCNLALDICINRLLFEAYGDKMRKASQRIYPETSKTTPIALADCSADPGALSPELAAFWSDVWRLDAKGQPPPLNPASVYFRLLRLLNVGKLPAFTCYCAFSGDQPRTLTERFDSTTRSVAEDISKRLPRGSGLGGALSEYSVVPMRIGTDRVEAFLRQMQVRRVQDETAKKILEPLSREIRVQPYPAFPTRLGLVYQMCGISDSFGLFWNRDVANAGARMAVGIYVDVSGSMAAHYRIIAGFVSALREVPLHVRSFDTRVHAVDVEAFSTGKIKGGGGTDFDAPIRDLLETADVEAAVLFTDGEATVSADVGRKLRLSRKRLYVVYLGGAGRVPSSPLSRYAKDSIAVPTD